MTVAVCVAGALGGCDALRGGADVTVDGVALWGHGVGAGDGALLEGTLTVEDGCVYVTDITGTRWLPVFSEDRVGWDGETLSAAGGAFVDGDPISLAGGVLVEGASAWEPPEGLHVPAPCEPENVWNGTR